MTDTWTVTRSSRTWDEGAGAYVNVPVTVYSGPGKLASFDPYERTAEGVDHQQVEMRPMLHLPFSVATSADVMVDDVAECVASPTDSALVGSRVRVAGVSVRTHRTARRFPVSEVLPS